MSIEREDPKIGFEEMDFEQLEGDPEYSLVLQEAALEYLQTEDSEYFERDFTGELDSDGYLIRKDGKNSNTKPSQNIGPKGMEYVAERTKEKLRNRAE